MPNILIKVPHGVFPSAQLRKLTQTITEVASVTEQIPAEMKKRFLCWITVDEVSQGMFTCGGMDTTQHVIPCIAMVYLPAGVLDGASRAQYVNTVHAAFASALSADDKRQIATSVILHEIPDGQWGANGSIWQLPDFAKAAGYAHLQHLTT